MKTPASRVFNPLVAITGLVVLSSCAILLIACSVGNSNLDQPPGGIPNQLGRVTKVSEVNPCPPSTVSPPVNGDRCVDLTISCPGVAVYNPVELKVTNAVGTPKGTVIYTTGGGGNDLYENQFVYGNVAVNDVVNAGFTVVQTNFNTPVGWLDGPGGPLLLACRWATAAKWIHDNIGSANTAFCATGNSAGAGAIAYALSRYGEDSIFNFVQPTGGPPFSRIDYGCLCNMSEVSNCAGTLDTCYGTDANLFLDPAYGNNHCSSQDQADSAIWQADSILSSDNRSVLNYSTRVHFIFGGLDTGSGSGEAVIWENAITSQHDFECVPNAPHLLADVPEGAAAIANGLINNCH
ncbi:MAG TPA: hypothetical protein VMT28_02715 [Terriglobales bacterium]|jgi:hypothetical protein|nr:hypothetical protein [Terriglobales bacterium]